MRTSNCNMSGSSITRGDWGSRAVLRITLEYLVLLLLATPAFSAQPLLSLTPTRLVLERGQDVADISLLNAGDAAGSYEISLTDMHMPETGVLQEIVDATQASFSLRVFAHVAPRQVTLAPGAQQRVRVLVRPPFALEDGEYRSHLKISLRSPRYVHGDGSEEIGDMIVRPRQRTTAIVPVIYRGSGAHAIAGIGKVRVQPASAGAPAVIDIEVLREGNASVYGDLVVSHRTADGDTRGIARQDGVAVYRPTPLRRVQLKLNGPVPRQGVLIVEYLSPDSTQPLSAKEIEL